MTSVNDDMMVTWLQNVCLRVEGKVGKSKRKSGNA